MVIHTVQPGDSLYRIAQMHGVPLPFLIQQNELREPYRLTPGQAIVVPQPTQTYTVKRGDTLGDIAARNGTTVLALWQNNPQLGGTDRIYPGQSLVLSYGPKLGTFAVNGYAYPNIDVRVLRKTLPYLTYLSIFSYGFDSMGRLLPQNADLLTRMARQYGVRPLLVLTTLGEDGQFSGERAHRLFQDTASRSALVENLAQTLAAQGFAGVDIDFEFVPPEDAAAYAAFVRDVRARLEPAGNPTGEYRRILISRPNAQFDSDIGFLPGDEQEKISPLMRPIIDNLEQLIDSNEEERYKDEMELQGKIDEIFERGMIQTEALNYIRGRSIVKTYLIIDEAQNMTPNQVKGIITRAGKGTKIILLGDTNQIDRPMLDERTNGLSFASEYMKGSPLCWQVTFSPEECERSALAMDAITRL